MKRADISIQTQLAARKNWRGALIDAVTAAICYRQIAAPLFLDSFEFLLTERVKGAEKGQIQAHHGGFIEVTDQDIWAGAVREVKQEVGYHIVPDDLTWITTTGPALYRSELSANGDSELTLQISTEEAEPEVAFALPLFLADLTGKSMIDNTDGEVKNQQWMSLRNLIQQYGKKDDRPYSQFNYFHMLAMGLLKLSGQWDTSRRRPICLPGEYRFQF